MRAFEGDAMKHENRLDEFLAGLMGMKADGFMRCAPGFNQQLQSQKVALSRLQQHRGLFLMPVR